MTEPRDVQREHGTEAATADRELEVRPEVISDLDLADQDVDLIRGGPCSASASAYVFGVAAARQR